MTVYAESIMTRTVVTAGPDDTAMRSPLFSKTAHGVPVCDKDGKLLGIISEGDLMRPFGEANKLHRDWWLGLLADGESWRPNSSTTCGRTAGGPPRSMTKEVVTATEDTPVDRIADLLQSHRIKRVPIVRDGKVVGVVSRADEHSRHGGALAEDEPLPLSAPAAFRAGQRVRGLQLEPIFSWLPIGV